MSDQLAAIVLALGAAFSWGLSAVLVRRGLAYMETASGTFVSLVAGFVLTALLVLAFELDELLEVSATAVLMFAIVGVLNFPLGRFFNYMSMARLGVGRSTPLLASAPVFAMVLAVIFTGEEVSVLTLVGTAMILGGLYITLRAPAANARGS